MAIPASITELSTTASSNPPAGSESTAEGDNQIRAAYSFIAQLHSEKAPKASPTFTGTPAAPTAAVDTNTTQLATTAFVIGQAYAKLASPTFTGTVTAAAVTTTGNTILGNAFADTVVINGPVGVGVSPSAWGSGNYSVDVGSVGAFQGDSTASRVTQNCYYDGTNWRAKTTGACSIFVQSAGEVITYNSASTTAGAIVTFAERSRLNLAGNFLPILTAAAPTLNTNGQLVFNLTSDTNLRISVRGTDGVTRTANITLA